MSALGHKQDIAPLPQKRTFAAGFGMSAKCQKRTFAFVVQVPLGGDIVEIEWIRIGLVGESCTMTNDNHEPAESLGFHQVS